MRTLMLAALIAASLFAPALAADAGAKPVAKNTVCATCDAKVDPKTSPTVTLKSTEGKDVAVAVCCNNCGAKAEKDPAKYADAALKADAGAKK